MRRLWRRIRFHFEEQRRIRELRQEMQLHRELRAEQIERRGIAPDLAQDAAAQQFGNTTLLLETARESWRWAWLDELFANLRYAARTWHRSPGFTLVVVLTLALAISANSAVFSIFHAVLLQTLPYRDPERLVVVWDRLVKAKNAAPVFASFADFEQLRRYSHSFRDVSAATWAWSGRVWRDHGVS